MKILYVNTCYQGGGAEKVARQLYWNMKDIGAETYFLSGRSKSRDDIDSIYYDAGLGLLYNRTKSYLANNSRRNDFFSREKIIKTIKDKKIDIVHFHNIHGNYLGIKDISKISKHCKVVWTLHDMWAMTGHCAYSLSCENWYKNECYECSNKELYPITRQNVSYNRFLLKEAYFTGQNINFVVPSNWLLEICKKSFLRNEKISVIENGVRVPQISDLQRAEIRKKLELDDNKITLMFTANELENRYKGLKVLLQALESVKNKKRFQLLIVGKGEKVEFNKEYECRYMGYIQRQQEMDELYLAADVLIFPSQAENFPCTILESMAVGTPVIASRVGGIAEQIDEEAGWLFEREDTNELARIIENLSFTESYKMKRKNCRLRIQKEFTEEKMMDKYYKLYSSLISTRG